MNERIRELYDQALETKFDYGGGVGIKPGEYYSNYITVLNPEKFAELIVRECINIGDNYEEILGNEPECFNCRKVAYGIVDKIKNHFGVGE